MATNMPYAARGEAAGRQVSERDDQQADADELQPPGTDLPGGRQLEQPKRKNGARQNHVAQPIGD